jgi:DNA-binding NarL/FixJ family response regulator
MAASEVSSSSAMRIVLAEDSVLLREGVARLLSEYGHEVVAGLSDAAGLTECVVQHAPDLVIVDVRMPPTHTDEGLRAAVELREVRPGTKVLVLSQYVEERYAADLLASGSEGLGYLLKERVADVREFVDACQRVAAGGTVLDPEVVSQLLVRARRQPLDALSPREREVLSLMAEGRSNSAIAERMVVSAGAVEKHISSIFMKLDLPPSDSEHRRVLAVLRYLQL